MRNRQRQSNCERIVFAAAAWSVCCCLAPELVGQTVKLADNQPQAPQPTQPVEQVPAPPRVAEATPSYFNLQDPAPLPPILRSEGGATNPNLASGPAGQPTGNTQNNQPNNQTNEELRTAMLGNVTALNGLSADRRSKALSPGADAVLGEEGLFRKTTDSGDLLGKSATVRGVSSQQRTPITTDTRVRGERTGQVLAAGSYWAPVRQDLDTMMNKIDSRLIDSLIVIKGPYSPRYGPGFSFIDIDLLPTPRYALGSEFHGTTSVDYLTNGEQVYGRQTIFGGDADSGYRASYGHRTGNDYTAGDGREIPSSYKSRDINLAFGRDLDPHRKVEFNYLRLDQTDVEYPGLVFDTRYLVTDGYEIKYFDEAPRFGDFHMAEVWYNRTRFEGDTLAPSKDAQIPNLRWILYSPSGFDGFGITDGDGSSLGYRSESIAGDVGYNHLAFGTDMILLKQGINDREALLDPSYNNFPLPPSQSVDFGFYLERVLRPHEYIQLNMGARIDTIRNTSTGFVDGAPFLPTDGLLQTFTTWQTYINAQADLTSNWKATAGAGLGQRPPTLTELYVRSAFIGSLQRGLTFMLGDRELSPETLLQIDMGLIGQFDRLQVGANAYHAWIEDYITYDLFAASSGADGLADGVGYVNTPRATLAGVESFIQYQMLDSVSLFGNLSYVQGTDRTRNEGDYFDLNLRSRVFGVEKEALPGIPPLDSRVGILFHDASPDRLWGLECSVRAVARQNRIAATLQEVATPGFATVDIRGFRRLSQNWLLTGGIENVGDRFYQEHLDYRTGTGVFRPGIGYYTGLEISF